MKTLMTMIGAMVASLVIIADEPKPDGGPYTETVGEIEWRFMVENGEASIGMEYGDDDWSPACSADEGAVEIPSVLGGRPVTRIRAHAFHMSSFNQVTIPSSVTQIGDAAFYDCLWLTSVTIPSSVWYIGEEAFAFDALTSLTIPSGVTVVRDRAFWCCDKLTSVTIQPGVRDIGTEVFRGCRKIQSATVPGWTCGIDFTSVKNLTISDGTTSISNSAFMGCVGLTSVTIPSSVTNIGSAAFCSCEGLTSVTIPSSVMSIGESAFANCSGLQDFFVSSVSAYFASVDGVLFNKDRTQLVCYPGAHSGPYEVPSSVTNVAASAFSYCNGLTRVTIPASVKSIGSRAFLGCANLMEVMIDGDAPTTGDSVFEGTPGGLTIRASEGSSGWAQWNGRTLVYGGSAETGAVTLTVTNVVVHYIQTSELSPMAAPITKDTGSVNIMTEIKGGIVPIPDSWATNYPSFKTKFGDNFTEALTKPTGKFDAGNNPMLVWQDYVAGTDPTDEDDQFRASVTLVDNVPVISYTPELSDAEKAKRIYTTLGKVKLTDTDWVIVPNGSESDYNFFKVTVEMK